MCGVREREEEKEKKREREEHPKSPGSIILNKILLMCFFFVSVFSFFLFCFVLWVFFCFLFFVFFAISWAAPMTYGSSQARGLIGAVAADLRQSHRNKGSEPRLQPTPQLTAMPDP